MLTQLAALTERIRHSALAFPVAVLAAVLMIGISELAYFGAQARLERLVVLGDVRNELIRVLRRVTDAESGKRGYLLTGGSEYLLPYQSARSDVQDGLRRLELQYRALGDADAERLRKHIAGLVNAKLSEMEEVLRLHDAGRTDAALDIIRSGIGRDQMDQLRTEVDSLVRQQNERISDGVANVYDTLLANRIGVATMTILSLLVMGMFLRQGRLLDHQRQERAAAVQAERDRLEAEVVHRTQELTELARHLQTAREDERARLARDLHDELGALLTAAKLDVARIRPKLQQAAPDLLPRLAHLTEALNSGIALKRNIIEDLRPSTLSSLGLCPALEILCSEFAERSGVKVTTALEPVPLDAGADLTVFRMVQEALTNIAKYAKAAEVSVSLKSDAGEAVVIVQDDGVGFDTTRSARGSHGLIGMRFRVEAERGQLGVRSAPGHGTVVTARLPLRPAEGTPSEARAAQG
jgi:signal transduction histidine kinase